MESRDSGPPVRLTSPVTVPDCAGTTAGSQQGPLVPHSQNYGGQPHRNFPPENLIQQQGQTTEQQQCQIWQQQHNFIGGQNQRMSQNQNEVHVPSQQSNFNPNFSMSYSGDQHHLGIPTATFIHNEGQTDEFPTSQQLWHQQHYSINGQNCPLAPNKSEVYMPYQQQSLNQQMSFTSRPALIVDQDYGAQDRLGFNSRYTVQRLEQTTAQPTSNQQQQQHQQWLLHQQQFTNKQMAPHENNVSNQQPYTEQELKTFSRPSIFLPQNNRAQAPSGPYPFIQQQGYTTLKPALQQQQPHQQHLLKEHNELSTPHRYTPHHSDAYMPFHRPTFDQFMSTPSRQMRTSLVVPIKSTSSSPLHPMGNMSASPDDPIENVYNSSDVPVGSIYTFPAVPMDNMSARTVVPMGNISTSPAPAMENISTFPLHHIGNMPASPPVPMGNKSPTTAVAMGNVSTSPAAPMENMSAAPAASVEKIPASFADPMGNMSTCTTSSTKNMSIPHLDLTDDSFPQFPIMAEKRNYDESTGENENSILAKRQKTDEDIDPLCASEKNEDLSGNGNTRLYSENNKDPLSDLTKDQRVVLYTLFLCMDKWGEITIDDEVSMGDIDVRKIVKELEKKGLVESYSDNKKYIPYDKQSMIMKYFREDCLLSEIDKDFFIQVASDESIRTYAKMYCRPGDGPRESEDIGPITTTRLIVEGHGNRLPYSLRAKLPAFLLEDEEVLGMFGKLWCKARNTNPLSDQIPDEKIKNFYSASTILSGLKNELIEMQLSEKKWSILISILMSENYSVRVSTPWEEKRKIIQQTFKAIQDGKEGNTEENFGLLKELGHCDKLITVDKENNKVYFVSEEIRHQVMGYFVLNCLESERDYENYLNLSSVDSIFEYVRPWSYMRSLKERCVYLPERTEKSFIERLGIDAIKFAADIYDFKYKISSKRNAYSYVKSETPFWNHTNYGALI